MREFANIRISSIKDIRIHIIYVLIACFLSTLVVSENTTTHNSNDDLFGIYNQSNQDSPKKDVVHKRESPKVLLFKGKGRQIIPVTEDPTAEVPVSEQEATATEVSGGEEVAATELPAGETEMAATKGPAGKKAATEIPGNEEVTEALVEGEATSVEVTTESEGPAESNEAGDEKKSAEDNGEVSESPLDGDDEAPEKDAKEKKSAKPLPSHFSLPMDTFGLSMPLYNPLVMTPEHFLQEANEFFIIRNIPDQSRLMLIFRMFPADSDTARWWRETRHVVKDWAGFCKLFLAYEKSGQSKDELLLQLFNKKQLPTEAFETFSWDVSSLFSKIEINIDVQEVISRILNACLPEISVYLRQHNFKSISNLNAKAREVIVDLNKIRAAEGKYLLRARQTDPIVEAQPTVPPFQSISNLYGREFQSQSRQRFYILSEEMSTPVPSQNNQVEPIKCVYCNTLGHTIDHCQMKKLAEERQNSRFTPQNRYQINKKTIYQSPFRRDKLTQPIKLS